MKSEAKLAELLGRMRLLEADHMPDDWPAVKMEDITALCDAVVAANSHAMELRSYADAVAAALDGYQDCCGEGHPRPAYDCETCGAEESVLTAYREFVALPR